MRAVVGICIVSLWAACNEKNMFEQHAPTAEDLPFANVFKPWEGTWIGTFKIYSDPEYADRPPAPKHLDPQIFESMVLRDTIRVTQQYQSESTYFQRVTIRDRYADHTEESRGVNKVENGRLWCLVRKPNELVIHQGSIPQEGSIVWRRDERNPVRREYFLETVTDSIYTIIGWGYYDGDNLALGPRTWFHATYTKE